MNRRALLALLATPALSTTARAQTPTLAFTAIPDQDESRLVERFGRVATYLQAQLGIPVAYVPVKTYPAAVTAFTNNQVQLAWFGGFTGVQARRAVPDSEAIAQGVEDTKFRSFFIANSKLGLTRGDDFPRGIEGHSFTFGARASTSGRVMPEYYIRQAFKKAPDQVFSRVGFSGDHTRTLQLVQSGAYEAGAMDFTIYDLEQKAGRVDTALTTIIWQTPTFPDYNWTIRGDVDTRFGPGLKERLRAALIACKDPAILSQFARTGFIPATNAEYAPIEQVAQQTELLD